MFHILSYIIDRQAKLIVTNHVPHFGYTKLWSLLVLKYCIRWWDRFPNPTQLNPNFSRNYAPIIGSFRWRKCIDRGIKNFLWFDYPLHLWCYAFLRFFRVSTQKYEGCTLLWINPDLTRLSPGKYHPARVLCMEGTTLPGTTQALSWISITTDDSW